MHLSKYATFEIEDFVDDPSFRDFVLKSDLSNQHFWRLLIQKYPQQSPKIEAARQLVLQMAKVHTNAVLGVNIDVHTSLAQLNRFIEVEQRTKRGMSRRKSILGAAALITLIVGSFFTYSHLTSKRKVFKTANGERLTINLQDGTTVNLNANSSLHYYPGTWSEGIPREVWLEGEAFFDVRKHANSSFIVKTDELQIMVLGTQFNVRARNDQSEVVLEEGKIELEIKDAKPDDQHVFLEPGDYISFEPEHRTLARKKVQAGLFSAWKDGFVVFNNISLLNACEELEMIFGIRFRILKPELGARTIRLSIPGDDLDAVLNTLEGLYPEEIHLERKMNEIIIY